nr:DUF1549 domain-containing protein [Planctomycetota bacterium]
MAVFRSHPHSLVAVCAAVLSCMAACAWSADAVDPARAAPGAVVLYNRDVRPILAENCFACHGPDANKRKAGLGLHRRESAISELKSGRVAVIPGQPDASELIKRVLTSDEDDRMPPAATGKKLTPAQVTMLREWIAQDAQWQPHWSYLEPDAAATKASISDDRWSRTPIDRFIFDRLQHEGLQPSPEADPITLIRRLGFDLIGLPPSIAEVDAFAADHSADAYEQLIDRLLASPHFGERMAVYWLDLVRYADTTGFHSDNTRNVTPYRDYVITAFNDDLPFDRFTIEQLAGDLLPDATLSQRIASGYNRLNMTTEEGGAQPKEYENKHAADRVRNVSTVWMGATMGCCECHDHKFDPYSTKDFYRMEAFFADIQEAPIGAREPGMPVPTAAQQAELARLDAEISPLRTQLATTTTALAAAQAEWENQFAIYHPSQLGPWSSIGPFKAAAPHDAYITDYPPEHAIDLSATNSGGTAEGAPSVAWVAHPEWKDGEIHTLTGDNSATYVYRTIEATAEDALQLSLGSDDTITVWVNGQQVLAKEVYRGVAPDQDKLSIALKPGTNALLMKIVNGGGGYGFYFQVVGRLAPDDVTAIEKLPAAERSEAQLAQVATFYRTIAPLLEPVRAQLAGLEARTAAIDAMVTRVLVSTAGPPRVVKIRARGNWQDESGEVVEPGVPHFLAQLDAKGRATRLDLARWLAAHDNPLTARVFMNRLWRMYFGVGLSKSLDDLGAQGEWPVHPELLDWLAIDFRDHGWDVKRAIKQLVMSSAYRQTSHAGALRERDPDNRLIARQSSFRLDAEFVRDDVLAISGLLVPTIGGPSVRPYQPAGYLMHLNFPARDWKDESDGNEYRRGLYTFWQ